MLRFLLFFILGMILGDILVSLYERHKRRSYSGRLIIVEDEDGTYTFLEFDEYADPEKLKNGQVLKLEVRKKHISSNGKN